MRTIARTVCDEQGNIILRAEDSISFEEALRIRLKETKEAASIVISEIEGANRWRLQRAEQRLALNSESSELTNLYTAIEEVRLKSDLLEEHLNGLTEVSDLINFNAYKELKELPGQRES